MRTWKPKPQPPIICVISIANDFEWYCGTSEHFASEQLIPGT